MCLSFDRKGPPVIKGNGSGIVLEYREDEGMIDRRRGIEEGLQQTQALPRRMETMIRPGLREHLDLGIG